MKMNLLVLPLLLWFSISSVWSQAQDMVETGEYLYKTYENGDDILQYRILYPDGFDPKAKYPVVVFLHGMGERGDDNETQLRHGARLFQDSMKSYPAIVIFPQCPVTDYWANLERPDEGGAKRKFTFYYDEAPHPTLQLVIELIDKVLAESYTDKDRLYVSGLSMGGMGAFELSYRLQNKVAAAMPICGGGPKSKGKEMTKVPYWVFHGIKDDVVHYRYSIAMTRAIQQAGGKAKITLFPEANHNSWDPAFADPDFLSWMFAQKRN